MSKASSHKKQTPRPSEGAHQTLLLESRPSPVKNQQVKFYFRDNFFILLLVVLALIFLIILAAAIALYVGDYSGSNQSVRRVFDQEEKNTTDSLELTTSDDNLTVTEAVTVNLERMAIVVEGGLPRGVHVEENIVIANED